MINLKNWNAIKESAKKDRDYSDPTAGGYVCIIRKAVDVPEKEYIYVEVDIAEGEFKNYASDVAERAGFWPLKFNKSYRDNKTYNEAGLPTSKNPLHWFAKFITAVEETNNGYIFKGDAETLAKKGVGIVFQEAEYIKKNGEIGIKLEPFSFTTAAKIRAGEFKTPTTRKPPRDQGTPKLVDLSEEEAGELPF